MPAKYQRGQKVIVKPVSEQSISPRDSVLRQYVGLVGEITDYYWITPPTGDVFYLYTVQIGTGDKDIVLYEDEIQHMPKTKSGRRSLKDK